MAASYPGALKSFTTKVDNVDDIVAAHVNDLQDEVVAIETALGTYPDAGVNCFRLLKSGANLTLEPVNGIRVDINNTIKTYTSMPTLGTGGLSASTFYYIYLYDNAGTATLEASTTAFTVDTTGRANKTGDATRRLMGIANTTAGTAWADTATQRFVLSYDNRRPTLGEATYGSERSSASASWTEVSSAERVEFVHFATSILRATCVGYVDCNTLGAQISFSLAVNGSVVGGFAALQETADYRQPLALNHRQTGPGGAGYVSLFAQSNGSAVAAVGVSTVLQVEVD